MTDHAPTTISGQRLLLLAVLTAIALAAVWIANFLLNFDLNNYRRQAEEKLSALLSLPVKVGDMHYNLHDTSLALHVAALQIGDNGSNVQVDAPNILIDLQWWGLFERDIKFARINLVDPHITIRTTSDGPAGGPSPREKPVPTSINLALLQSIGIDNLEIRGGKVRVEVPRPGRPAERLEITELDGLLAGLRLNNAAQISIKGMLHIPGQKAKSAWQLRGESSLEMDESNVLEPHLNLDLLAKDLDLGAIQTFFIKKTVDYAVAGKADLHLHIEGSPKQGFALQTGLSSDRMTFYPGAAYTRPLPFKKLLASGHLQTAGEQPGIRALTLQIDESRLAGTIGWAPAGQPFSATATLVNSQLAVSQVKQWLPDDQQAWQAIRQGLLEQGSILVESAEFTLFENQASQKTWRVDQLQGEFRQVTWNHATAPALEIMSLPFTFADKLWQIRDARGRCGTLQLAVSGAGEYGADGTVVTSLDFSGEALPGTLLEEWQIPQHALSLDGQVGLRGHLEGPLDRLTLDLQADLSRFSVSHPGGLALTPEAKDKLAVHATLTPQKISLDHGTLKWSVAGGHISGAFLMGNPDSLAIDALLTIDDLTRLAEVVPQLEKLQLHGQADLSISQRGRLEGHYPEMVLTLRDAGLHATRHIADLSHINGRAQLTPTGLTADNLRVHLGESPLTVQARLEDFSDTHLLLDVKAPALRADELIFYSDKAILRDITGHLEIDRDGLAFAPVEVRLDGGTQASVRGTISFHAPFDVQLDITSGFARIGEVISLWAARSEASKRRAVASSDQTDSAGPQATIKIQAQVKRGDLYGMSFHDASGLIVPSRKRLNIHPLDFSVGEGFCNAQVLTDFTGAGPSLLRISGHAQDVDALEVYRELLNQKNIVRGKLRGDFYLSGEIGANYLPSSYGNFSLQIHDGVLHQFQFLSKVFSLLNVSQIFALQLPDMDTEGMPFDLLTANLQLDKGIIKSEDLKIQSEAMNQSYAGQLNLIDKEVDFSVAINPLGTVDKVVSRIPVAGWLLTGEDKALLTAHFTVRGKASDVSVTAMPLETLSEPTLGLLKRTLSLPFKLFEDPQILWGGDVGKE